MVKQKIENHKFYPNSAKRRSIQGRVGLALSIGKNGKIISLKIIQSSGSDILDTAAVQSVHKASPFGIASKTIGFSFGIKFYLENN